MTLTKTVAQARKELRAVAPHLVDLYDIQPSNGGVQLIRGQTSIISTPKSYGGKNGLYEIRPMKDGKDFKDLFRTTDAASGWLHLNDAVLIAEATVRFPVVALETIVNRYFNRR